MEPVAAGSASFLNAKHPSSLYTIVDVGAGTTDIATFFRRNNKDGFRLGFQRASTVSSTFAGDAVDLALRNYLSRVNSMSAADARRIPSQIMRLRKEDLFNAERPLLVLDFGTGRRVSIDRTDFLAGEEIASVKAGMFTDILRSFHALPADYFRGTSNAAIQRIHVVFTGGGARLPWLSDEMEKVRSSPLAGLNFASYPTMQFINELPEWLRGQIDEAAYPPLAVAAGGALEELPLPSSVGEVPAPYDVGKREVPPVYKGT